jgi:mannose-1-phosphate guanylyltransferase
VRRDQRRERHHLAIVVAYVILFDVALAEALFIFRLKEDAPLPAKTIELIQKEAAEVRLHCLIDDYFANDAAFGATVRSAIEVSRKHRDSIVLIGAKPQWPEVEYGWIEPGASMTTGSGIPLFNVNRFWEKPPLATAHQLMKTGGLWNTFVTIGHGSAFLRLLTGTVPSAVSEISKALTKGDPDAPYRDMGSIDFSKHVLSQDQRPLLVIQDEVSGWADLGNPVRVIETLMRNRIVPSWLRKMRDVPRLFEEITGVGPSMKRRTSNPSGANETK